MGQVEKVSLKDFLAGKEIRFECIYKPSISDYYKCRYKVDGKWEKAQICFETGVIKIHDCIVRRGKPRC